VERRRAAAGAAPGPLAGGVSLELPTGGLTLEAVPLLVAAGRTWSLPDSDAEVTRRRGGLEAAWPGRVRLRLRATGGRGGWRLACTATAETGLDVDAVGVRLRLPSATRICVDGYHSWDWAGVRDATVAGRGWWGAIWGRPGGEAVAVAAARAPRLGPVSLAWDGAGALDVVTAGDPAQESRRTAAPRRLGSRLAPGEQLAAEPVDARALDRRGPSGAGLPAPPRGCRPPGRRRVGWMSWNCLGFEVTAQDAAAAADHLVPPGGVVLLDDGWMPWWGDWEERDDLDCSIAGLAAALRRRGRRLGVWVAPFLVDPRSAAAALPGLPLLRDAGGTPVVDRRPASPQWILDAASPAGRRRLAALGRRLGSAGVAVLKLDFLYAGALPGARPHGWSGVAALRAGVGATVRGFRAAAPRGAAVWACGAPAAPLAGLVDACRSGGDSVVNVPTRGAPPPLPPWFLFGELSLRAQARNLAARAWLWGATVPPDVDAVTLGPLAARPPAGDAMARPWLEMAVRSGGPLLVADAPDRRLPPARARALRAAQAAVAGHRARPRRPLDPLAMAPAPMADDDFLDWPDDLPADWEEVPGRRRTAGA
jgi:alpha-galactosidase